ncbi:hypothetical protein J6590_044725 [Homalodisca vitripennis]|nr:hypothetical protein J6590_044725 [Homalodisca vitripennis]
MEVLKTRVCQMESYWQTKFTVLQNFIFSQGTPLFPILLLCIDKPLNRVSVGPVLQREKNNRPLSVPQVVTALGLARRDLSSCRVMISLRLVIVLSKQPGAPQLQIRYWGCYCFDINSGGVLFIAALSVWPGVKTFVYVVASEAGRDIKNRKSSTSNRVTQLTQTRPNIESESKRHSHVYCTEANYLQLRRYFHLRREIKRRQELQPALPSPITGQFYFKSPLRHSFVSICWAPEMEIFEVKLLWVHLLFVYIATTMNRRRIKEQKAQRGSQNRELTITASSSCCSVSALRWRCVHSRHLPNIERAVNVNPVAFLRRHPSGASCVSDLYLCLCLARVLSLSTISLQPLNNALSLFLAGSCHVVFNTIFSLSLSLSLASNTKLV